MHEARRVRRDSTNAGAGQQYSHNTVLGRRPTWRAGTKRARRVCCDNTSRYSSMSSLGSLRWHNMISSNIMPIVHPVVQNPNETPGKSTRTVRELLSWETTVPTASAGTVEGHPRRGCMTSGRFCTRVPTGQLSKVMGLAMSRSPVSTTTHASPFSARTSEPVRRPSPAAPLSVPSAALSAGTRYTAEWPAGPTGLNTCRAWSGKEPITRGNWQSTRSRKQSHAGSGRQARAEAGNRQPEAGTVRREGGSTRSGKEPIARNGTGAPGA
eukprot:1182467-Prorocentrum_minimum.AAC.1